MITSVICQALWQLFDCREGENLRNDKLGDERVRFCNIVPGPIARAQQ